MVIPHPSQPLTPSYQRAHRDDDDHPECSNEHDSCELRNPGRLRQEIGCWASISEGAEASLGRAHDDKPEAGSGWVDVLNGRLRNRDRGGVPPLFVSVFRQVDIGQLLHDEGASAARPPVSMLGVRTRCRRVRPLRVRSEEHCCDLSHLRSTGLFHDHPASTSNRTSTSAVAGINVREAGLPDVSVNIGSAAELRLVSRDTYVNK